MIPPGEKLLDRSQPHPRGLFWRDAIVLAVLSLIGLSVYQELTSNRISCGNLAAARQWLWEHARTIDDASPAAQCEFFAKGQAVYAAMKLCVPNFQYDPVVQERIEQTVKAKKAQCGW